MDKTIKTVKPNKMKAKIIEKLKELVKLYKNVEYWRQYADRDEEIIQTESELAALEQQSKEVEIIKALSGEKIEDIPTFTSTDYAKNGTDYDKMVFGPGDDDYGRDKPFWKQSKEPCDHRWKIGMDECAKCGMNIKEFKNEIKE